MRQLEVLCAVIETGSITRASQRLNLSQPAVSKLIAALEEQIRLVLFRREHRRLIVTHYRANWGNISQETIGRKQAFAIDDKAKVSLVEAVVR